MTNSARRSILERAGFACEDCHAAAPNGRSLWCGLDLHHKERRRAGADDDPANIVVVCEKCHMTRRHGKGSKPYGRRRQTMPTDNAFLIQLPEEMLGRLYEKAMRKKTSTRGLIEIILNEWLEREGTPDA